MLYEIVSSLQANIFLLTTSILVRQVETPRLGARTSFLYLSFTLDVTATTRCRNFVSVTITTYSIRRRSRLPPLHLTRKDHPPFPSFAAEQAQSQPVSSADLRATSLNPSNTSSNLHTNIKDGRQIQCASISSPRPQPRLPITSTSNELRSELSAAKSV